MNKTLFTQLIAACQASACFDFNRSDQCVVPHALDLFNITSIRPDHDSFEEAIRAVATKLEMPYEDAHQLFYPHQVFEGFFPPNTKYEVIKALEHYLNTGEIPWGNSEE